MGIVACDRRPSVKSAYEGYARLALAILGPQIAERAVRDYRRSRWARPLRAAAACGARGGAA